MDSAVLEQLQGMTINASNPVLHPTSEAFIQILLAPYYQSLEQAASVDDVLTWIPQVFHGLSDEIINNISYALETEIDESEINKADDVKVVADSVISTIKSLIIEQALYIAQNAPDYYVLPWDIQEVIQTNEDLMKIFSVATQVPLTGDKLPVSRQIGPQSFSDSLSAEFVAGLLLFSSPLVANNDFYISMFGVPFSSEYITNLKEASRYTLHSENPLAPEDYNKYSVNIQGQLYTFNSNEFMRGFETGAMWLGVDHHRYWSELQSHDYDPNTKQSIDTLLTY